MRQHFDVIVAGLGAMGSAAVYHLARRGQRVLGIDRFAPPHTLGSSHGHTRIIREAYFEHPQYVPMVQRAYAAWEDLERVSGEHLFERTGGLMAGRADSAVVSGARASADRHKLPYEELSAADIRRRFPALRVADDAVGLLEPRAGILFPERCIGVHLRFAAAHGATLRTNDPVTAWSADVSGVGVKVDTASGGSYTADRFVISAGAWAHALLPELSLPLTIERSVVHWFDPARNHEDFTGRGGLPIFIWEYGPGLMIYGFPARDEGVKVALHHQGERTADVASVRREVGENEIVEMRALLERLMPDLNGPWRTSTVCLYTNTPDEDFVIDAHPAHPQVLIVSPCSGHGFKFSSAIGEIVTDLVVEGESAFDLTPFRLARLITPASPASPGAVRR
jgi:sarcosine oxidase